VKSRFEEGLLKANRLAEQGFESWLFHPDMLFGAPRFWWGSRKLRPRPHEGIDLVLFRDRTGKIRSLGAGAVIPPLPGGKIVRISPDFIGASIYIAHESFDERGRRLYSLYGHLEPDGGVPEGKSVSENEILGSVARVNSGSIPSHLHLSIAFLPEPFPFEDLSWDRLGALPEVSFVDPLLFLEWHYSVLS
jgi:hypothetical protein